MPAVSDEARLIFLMGMRCRADSLLNSSCSSSPSGTLKSHHLSQTHSEMEIS